LSRSKFVVIANCSINRNCKNHNHRPCRWFAQAPLWPITCRAYRLIEFSFPCMSCPTTTNVVCSFSWPPLTRGLAFAKQKTGGEIFFSSCFSPSVFACGESTSLIRGRQAAVAGLGIAKAFWNHRHSRWYSYTISNRRPGWVGGYVYLLFLPNASLSKRTYAVKDPLLGVRFRRRGRLKADAVLRYCEAFKTHLCGERAFARREISPQRKVES